MKQLLISFLLLCAAAPALGASRSGSPAKFLIPFANSAGGAYINYPIPTPSQIGVQCGKASLTDGEPPLTMQAASAGGCPPLGQDFNGIFKQITQWNQQTQMGALPAYDPSFSSSIGGYPEGSILSQASNPSCIWLSTTDNNTTDPDTGGSGWTGSCPGGGISTAASTGSANAQIITTSPTSIGAGTRICWKPGFTNTGPLQINVNGSGLFNVVQRTPQGLIALAGGEVLLNSMTCVTSDGADYELDTSAANASLVQPDQTLSGGANVTSYNLGTGSGGGTVTIDCGKGPLQYITNAGSFTIAAPAIDGSTLVEIVNSSSAGAVTFSGFKTNSNTGEPLTTTNGSAFVVTIWRIAGTSSFIVKALQ